MLRKCKAVAAAAICLMLVFVPSVSQAQAGVKPPGFGTSSDGFGGSYYVEPNRGNWNPSNWYQGPYLGKDPCTAQAGNPGDGSGLNEPIGTQGEPSPCSYWLGARHVFAPSLAPILFTLLGLIVAMLAIWQGPRVVKMLVQRFSKPRYSSGGHTV